MEPTTATEVGVHGPAPSRYLSGKLDEQFVEESAVTMRTAELEI
jgi:hypothetical protein